MTQHADDWVTIEQASAATGLSSAMIKAHVGSGAIASRRIRVSNVTGRPDRVLVRLSDVRSAAKMKPKEIALARGMNVGRIRQEGERVLPFEVRALLGDVAWWHDEDAPPTPRKKRVWTYAEGDVVVVRKLVPIDVGGERYELVEGVVYAVTDKLVTVQFASGYREAFSFDEIRPAEGVRHAG